LRPADLQEDDRRRSEMTDILTPKERSRRMSLIRGGNTKPEMVLRRGLHKLGFRYGLHGKSLPGKPDLVLRRYKTAIFVHGCFWHRHKGCPIATMPKSNVSFWRDKFTKNVARDKAALRALRARGWRPIVVWECQLSTSRRAAVTIEKVAARIRKEQV
jgi:DNA mismatch endonuclease (patch repair protein)